MKLQSMTDFVLHESFGVGNEIINKDVFYNKVSKYAKFLKKPLNLGMFVPCDLEGNVLDFEVYKGYVIVGGIREPKKKQIDDGFGVHFKMYYRSEYQEAQERVLFKGFELSYESSFSNVVDNEKLDISITFRIQEKEIQIIEYLSGKGIKLTESAIKQFM